MKSLTYLVYAKYIHFYNLFLIICSFLVLSFLFNLTTLKPISYSETIMLCVLGRFSHSHKFIMKLDNVISWHIGLCFLKRCMTSGMTQLVNTMSPVASRNIYWPLSYYGEGNGTPLQYSCLENPMDGGAWWAAVHGVAKSQTRLSDFPFTFHFHALEKEMATHSSVLVWRIPGMVEPGGLPSMGRTESDTTEAT